MKHIEFEARIESVARELCQHMGIDEQLWKQYQSEVREVWIKREIEKLITEARVRMLLEG